MNDCLYIESAKLVKIIWKLKKKIMEKWASHLLSCTSQNIRKYYKVFLIPRILTLAPIEVWSYTFYWIASWWFMGYQVQWPVYHWHTLILSICSQNEMSMNKQESFLKRFKATKHVCWFWKHKGMPFGLVLYDGSFLDGMICQASCIPLAFLTTDFVGILN